MATDLSAAAKKRGIKYFLISYTDLYGTQRAKLVPAAAIGGMQKSGAGSPGSRRSAGSPPISGWTASRSNTRPATC
jgi:glutamine synthetase